MWQAISTLLRDWHTEDAEIELKTELPGGEIHSAWHLRFGGKDYFVKCDERELLLIACHMLSLPMFSTIS